MTTTALDRPAAKVIRSHIRQLLERHPPTLRPLTGKTVVQMLPYPLPERTAQYHIAQVRGEAERLRFAQSSRE